MCGINGFVDLRKQLDYESLKKSTDIIGHRGPDDCGYQVFNLSKASVGLGHRRLSILDLSALGHQPMFDDSGKFAMIFNGEIYNFQSIRTPLEQLGYHFKSNSDTEVMICALKHYGLKAIDLFIGMFTIAFIDI